MRRRGRYFQGTDGRRYCYGLRPVFRCPNTTSEGEQLERVLKAAHWLGVDPAWLGQMLERAHFGVSGERQRDAQGRLTSRCAACSARLRRLGFACWIEAPVDPESSSGRIRGRLGASQWQQVEGPWYRDRQSQAREWARNRAQHPGS